MDHTIARVRGVDLPREPAAWRAEGRAPLSPEAMLVFAAVAREGGVRRGAQALDVPRSTVSRQLAALERVLGGSLVARSTRRFELTEMGHGLMEQCDRLEDVLKTTQQVMARSAHEPYGTLTIAASPLVGEELLPSLLADYLARHPRVRVDMRLSVDFVDLRSGIDLALRTGPLEDATDVYSTKLGTSLKGLYASAAYLERRGVPRTTHDLADHDCIVVGSGGRSRMWNFGPTGRGTRVVVSGSLRVDSYRLARDAAAAGAGVARIPAFFAAPLLSQGTLVPLLKRHWPTTTLYAVHTSGRPAPPKIRTFVTLLRERLRVDLR